MNMIDALIAFFGILSVAFTFVAMVGAFLLVRAFIRWCCGNADDTLANTKPLVRTRIQQSPIETEIADALAREYPNRKPAQFI